MIYRIHLLWGIKGDLTLKEILAIRKLYGSVKKFESAIKECQIQYEYLEDIRREVVYWYDQSLELKIGPKETLEFFSNLGKDKEGRLLNAINKFNVFLKKLINIRKDIITITNQPEITMEMIREEDKKTKIMKKNKLQKTLIGTLTNLIDLCEIKVNEVLKLDKEIKKDFKSN